MSVVRSHAEEPNKSILSLDELGPWIFLFALLVQWQYTGFVILRWQFDSVVGHHFYPGCSVMATQVRIQPMKVRFLPPGPNTASLAQLDQSTGLRSRGPGVRVSQDAPLTVDNILQLLYNRNLNKRGTI
jgi:hypothetical protein